MVYVTRIGSVRMEVRASRPTGVNRTYASCILGPRQAGATHDRVNKLLHMDHSVSVESLDFIPTLVLLRT